MTEIRFALAVGGDVEAADAPPDRGCGEFRDHASVVAFRRR